MSKVGLGANIEPRTRTVTLTYQRELELEPTVIQVPFAVWKQITAELLLQENAVEEAARGIREGRNGKGIIEVVGP